LGRLAALTLQYVPFKWSAPMLRSTSLRTLALHALPSAHLSLDRLLAIVAAHPALTTLSLHFALVLPPVLPLALATLPALRELRVGGHGLLAVLLESLACPALDALTLDLDGGEPAEDALGALLARSAHPPLRHLALAYALAGGGLYYAGGGAVGSWAFLAELPTLRSLHVGACAYDALCAALGPPDDDGGPGPHGGAWACPALDTLRLRACHAHAEGVGRLIQVVEARNVEGGPGVTKLRTLELSDCPPLGPDVVAWLHANVANVACVESPNERFMHPASGPMY
jgi:hypothetical protein